MRIFIALIIPEIIKRAILKIQSSFVGLPAEIRWVKKEDLHITLSFLGEVDQPCLSSISKELVEIAENKKDICGTLSGINLFPSAANPKIVLLNFQKGENEIIKLAKEVTGVLGGDYKLPHITIGRIDSVSNIVLLKKEFFQKTFEAKKYLKTGKIKFFEVAVMESNRDELGEKYKVLQKSSLA